VFALDNVPVLLERSDTSFRYPVKYQATEIASGQKTASYAIALVGGFFINNRDTGTKFGTCVAETVPAGATKNCTGTTFLQINAK
jgi:hypothetical protein